MKIQGVEIDQTVIDACVRRMKSAPFRAADISTIVDPFLASKGCAGWIGTRVANALIQKYRKLDKISLQYPVWTWVK